MKHLLLAVAFGLFAGLANPALADEEDAPGQWVCFAHDFVDSHAKGDPETEDCIQSYHKGQGICLSHAKSAAIERCLSYSKNKATCKINAAVNCFTANQARGRSRN